MGVLAVIAAGVGGFLFGAIWYSALGGPWQAAVGLSDEEVQGGMKRPWPYVIAVIGAILTAGMLRHVYATAGVEGPLAGLVGGLGAGLFIAAPWLVTSYGFAQRPLMLIAIDAAHVVGACTVIGAILGAFA